MKRREFLRTLAGAAALPLVPNLPASMPSVAEVFRLPPDVWRMIEELLAYQWTWHPKALAAVKRMKD